jgi:transcriptional regulator with XRE-family HTH domain
MLLESPGITKDYLEPNGGYMPDMSAVVLRDCYRRGWIMSTEHCGATGVGAVQGVAVPATGSHSLHRLMAVRQQQGLSRLTIARRLNIEIGQVQQQESESSDLPLSTVYAWQKVLGVPVAELLVEAGDALSAPVLKRSQLVRLMKTALAISEQTKQKSIRRMVQTMVGQLAEIMPELAKVNAWHIVGKRRCLGELGVAAQQSFSDEVFLDPMD